MNSKPLWIVPALAGILAAAPRPPARITQGTLISLDAKGQPAGECPLKNTKVDAAVTGFLARVTVTQEFQNTGSDKIEAVYTFPLPQNAAVDDMTMNTGARTVKGVIKRREEARAIYEAARDAGRVASLLDQERPNIFTQSVANILPGEKVRITISYVEKLKYEAGNYEFVFPMVVGPRYIPGNPTGKLGGGWAPDTDRVPDASRITPPVAVPGTRAGHDISISLAIDAGVPVDALNSPSHDLDIARTGPSSMTVKLKDKAVLPNKDFIVRYDVAGKKIEDAVLVHRDSRGGFFTLFLQPPDRVNVQDVTPKEIVFVLDTSGSMSGFPIEKAKESIKLALEGMNPQDTFNLITFSGDEHVLFPQPVPATRENLRIAQEFLAGRRGSGGTEMMKAVKAALDPSDKQDHIRIACFMTDGYVGNDMEIIAEVQKHPNARVFAFGIGSAVNRFLLDKMAEYGRGEVEYVGLEDDGSAAAQRFHERVRNPLLTDIAVDWNGLPVSETYPARIPDLFSAKPVVIAGRYDRPASGVIRLRGRMHGNPVVREIKVNFPDNEPKHDVLAALWARSKVDALMGQNFAGNRPDIQEQITQLGLDFRLMTQYTSFVAVEEVAVTDGGRPRTVQVPVEMPAGVSYEGVFGQPEARPMMAASPVAGMKMSRSPGFFGRTAAAPAPIAQPMASRDEREPARRGDGPAVKLDSRLRAVADRLKRGVTTPAPGEAAFVRNGKAEVQVWLTDSSAAAIDKLRKLGFEVVVTPKTAKLVMGRIAIAQLEALSQLDVVRFVAPM